MNLYKKLSRLFVLAFVVLYVSCLCILPDDVRHASIFKNCTNDTLLIWVSHHNCIDSVTLLLSPLYSLDNDIADTTEIYLGKRTTVKFNDFIFPDSTCATTTEALFLEQDTCFFFLVKWKDAKNYSWDEIRAKKLYKKWITTKNKDGDCDRNIRYDY